MKAIIRRVDGKLEIEIDDGSFEGKLSPSEIYVEFPTPQGIDSINFEETKVLDFRGTCKKCPSLIKKEHECGCSYYCGDVFIKHEHAYIGGTNGDTYLPPVQKWCPKNNRGD